MSSLTIRNVPDHVLERLRAQAARDRRSVTQEAIHLLELALTLAAKGAVRQQEEEIDAQVRAWRKLAGSWESDVSTEEEIRRIYAARSAGREVEL